MSFVPATILTGFLGSGKTTLLKRILGEAHGMKIAVIENEFGEENIDTEILIADTRENIVQMSNGCVCCTIRDDLRATLKRLAADRRRGALDFDRVVIETTGLADPGPVAQTFFMDEGLAESFTLDSILTMVDAWHAPAQLDGRAEARRQVGYADRLFVTKSDLVSAPVLDALHRRLITMNPRAERHDVRFGDIALSAVFDVHGFDLTATLAIDPDFLEHGDAHDHDADAGENHHAHPPGAAAHHHPNVTGAAAHAGDVRSFVFRADRDFDAVQLERFVRKLADAHGPSLLRYKGILAVDGQSRKVVLQGVHQLMNSDQGPRWVVGEPRRTRIVFIGIDLPEDFIRAGLAHCLV